MGLFTPILQDTASSLAQHLPYLHFKINSSYISEMLHFSTLAVNSHGDKLEACTTERMLQSDGLKADENALCQFIVIDWCALA